MCYLILILHLLKLGILCSNFHTLSYTNTLGFQVLVIFMNPAFCENSFLGIALRLAAAHSCNPRCVNGILGQFVLPSYVHTGNLSRETGMVSSAAESQLCSAGSWPCMTAHSDRAHGGMKREWCCSSSAFNTF